MEILVIGLGLYIFFGILVWLCFPYVVSKQAQIDWIQKKIKLIRAQQSEEKTIIVNKISKLEIQSKLLNTYHSQQNIKLHKNIKAIKFGSSLGTHLPHLKEQKSDIMSSQPDGDKLRSERQDELQHKEIRPLRDHVRGL